MPKYELSLMKDNAWHQKILSNYKLYYKQITPRNECVAFLVFSGISHLGTDSWYFSKEMRPLYAHAFHVHQRPYKTIEIHTYWIKNLYYFWYLWVIALPVDIFVHTAQFLTGETYTFLEGGAFFIPYITLHWILLFVSLLAQGVYYFPSLWDSYLYLLRITLIINEKGYILATRRLSLQRRIIEFIGFLYVCRLGMIS